VHRRSPFWFDLNYLLSSEHRAHIEWLQYAIWVIAVRRGLRPIATRGTSFALSGGQGAEQLQRPAAQALGGEKFHKHLF
jgi:hypothetical protein